MAQVWGQKIELKLVADPNWSWNICFGEKHKIPNYFLFTAKEETRGRSWPSWLSWVFQNEWEPRPSQCLLSACQPPPSPAPNGPGPRPPPTINSSQLSSRSVRSPFKARTSFVPYLPASFLLSLATLSFSIVLLLPAKAKSKLSNKEQFYKFYFYLFNCPQPVIISPFSRVTTNVIVHFVSVSSWDNIFWQHKYHLLQSDESIWTALVVWVNIQLSHSDGYETGSLRHALEDKYFWSKNGTIKLIKTLK